ncbi:MAG: recombinase family protein [Solirubrobacteraceae bacterium]
MTSGGPRPFGYHWAPWLDEQGKRRSRLEQVAAEVPVVERIYADCLGGVSQMRIATALNREGVKSSTGKRWTQASVRSVLTNPIYMGKVRHKGEVYEGAHEAIISEETWSAVQRRNSAQAKSPNNGGGRYPKGSHLMVKGLLRCGTCRSAMAPRTDPRANGPASETYHCLGRYGDVASCDQTPIDRVTVDEAILTELSTRYLDLEATRERLASKRAADGALATEALAQAEAEALKAGDALTRIERDYIDGAISAEKWNRLEATLTEERDAAEAAAERARSRTVVIEDDCEEETLRRLADLHAAVLGGIENALDLNALRTLLRHLFRVIYYQPTNRDHWSFHGPSDSHVPVPDAVLMPHLRGGGIANDVYWPKVALPLESDAAFSEYQGLQR